MGNFGCMILVVAGMLINDLVAVSAAGSFGLQASPLQDTAVSSVPDRLRTEVQQGSVCQKGAQKEVPAGSVRLAKKDADSDGKSARNKDGKAAAKPDLRYVDWDALKSGSGQNGLQSPSSMVNRANGKNNGPGEEQDSENGDDQTAHGDDKNGDDENEKEDKNGWDRIFDAPKLG